MKLLDWRDVYTLLVGVYIYHRSHRYTYVNFRFLKKILTWSECGFIFSLSVIWNLEKVVYVLSVKQVYLVNMKVSIYSRLLIKMN